LWITNSRFSFWWSNLYSVINKNATEEYDGSSWTGGGNLGTARRILAGAGTQTARFSFWWL
jgi:hypothetical protein